MAWVGRPPRTCSMRELCSARHTSPLKIVYWCLKESTEFRRIPRWAIRIKTELEAPNALAHAYRYTPTVLRQVRRSGAASPQPLHRDEKEGIGCHLLLYGHDVPRLGG